MPPAPKGATISYGPSRVPAASAIKERLIIGRVRPASFLRRQQLLHLVHDAVELRHRQIQRLARRHVHARVFEQVDWIFGSTGADEVEIAFTRRGVAGLDL